MRPTAQLLRQADLPSAVTPDHLKLLQYSDLRGEAGLRANVGGAAMNVSILKNAGLVEERREGNRIIYSLQASKLLMTVDDFLSAVCPMQLRERRRRAPISGSSA